MSQALSGSIRGRVTDQASAPVAGAVVKIENTETGFLKSAETAEDGYYVFPNLYQIDIRYTRTFIKLWERFQPKSFIEANNIFNHPNINSSNITATVNASTGAIITDPTFAPVSSLLEGRIAQLGVRVDW
jgi:hypothetical protein